LEISFHKQAFSLNQVFHWFNEQHIQVSSMRNKTNRLEQLFIDLVGNNKGLQAA
jgi:ABC-2 type transport system ATP-binding protein